MKLKVLVTTMHQNDMSILDKMNIQTDVVFANQTNKYALEEKVINGKSAIIISTATRGLSRNRNIALGIATADLIMFMDDDVVFYDRYEEDVIKAFVDHPYADAIRFSTTTVAISNQKKQGAVDENPKGFRKATRKELARYGVCGLVIKGKVLKRYNLHFNERFGAGTKNFCGEDTIFLQEMVNKGVSLYLSPVSIASIDKSESTWFDGYNDKYFYTIGKVLYEIYPLFSKILTVRSAYRFSRRDINMSFTEILKSYWKGIDDYKKEL